MDRVAQRLAPKLVKGSKPPVVNCPRPGRRVKVWVVRTPCKHAQRHIQCGAGHHSLSTIIHHASSATVPASFPPIHHPPKTLPVHHDELDDNKRKTTTKKDDNNNHPLPIVQTIMMLTTLDTIHTIFASSSPLLIVRSVMPRYTC
jgi:hypothetical protein